VGICRLDTVCPLSTFFRVFFRFFSHEIVVHLHTTNPAKSRGERHLVLAPFLTKSSLEIKKVYRVVSAMLPILFEIPKTPAAQDGRFIKSVKKARLLPGGVQNCTWVQNPNLSKKGENPGPKVQKSGGGQKMTNLHFFEFFPEVSKNESLLQVVNFPVNRPATLLE